LETAIGGRPKPELCFLPRFKGTLCPSSDTAIHSVAVDRAPNLPIGRQTRLPLGCFPPKIISTSWQKCPSMCCEYALFSFAASNLSMQQQKEKGITTVLITYACHPWWTFEGWQY